MKKARRTIKIIAAVFAAVFLSLFIACSSFYLIETKNTSLSLEKLEDTKTASKLEIYDINGTQIKPSSENYISIKKLSSHTKNAFICAEDKRFYNHSGIDYIRIGGALLSNLKTKSFSQGASTISQQLIKNTHLSNEKTIKRKLKEMKLTKALEKEFSKDEILELYLNNIYFGNGCYGIENASLHYFGKSASKLTLAESALLAGTINAPSVYDVENNSEKAIERRNLILSLMKKYGKISKDEYYAAKSDELTLNLTKLSGNNYLFNKIIEEACLVLKTSENQLKNQNYKIFTEINLNLQNKISNIIKTNYSSLDDNISVATIVINNKTNQVVSVTGNKNTLDSKKQPGSAIKPILVYAPAIENKNIFPATKILDDKINISGYTPQNADKQHHGYVSVRECIKNSYNIPAVKILQETGIETSKNFAKKLGINFSDSDNNLALALGGFSHGTTLKSLADSYSSFANSGNFEKSKYIKKITSNKTTLYSKQNHKTKAMSDSTAYLITDMLIDTAKSGTAKRLKNFSYEIASKTGTVGKDNSQKNTDAFNVSYTTNHTIISYFGGTNMNETINGSTYPTMLTKNILENLYASSTPQNFTKPKSVTTKNLSISEYEKNIISETDNINDSFSEIFAKNNLPQKTKSTLNLKLEVFNFENKKPILCFFTTPNHTYTVKKRQNKKEETISSFEWLAEPKVTNFEDFSAKSGQICEYFVEICEKSTNKIFKTNSVKLKVF